LAVIFPVVNEPTFTSVTAKVIIGVVNEVQFNETVLRVGAINRVGMTCGILRLTFELKTFPDIVKVDPVAKVLTLVIPSIDCVFNDIALITLENAIPFTSRVFPALSVPTPRKPVGVKIEIVFNSAVLKEFEVTFMPIKGVRVDVLDMYTFPATYRDAPPGRKVPIPSGDAM
jgi:hypothetical protein